MAEDRNTIDLQQLFRSIWKSRKLFFKVLPVVFILSCLYILCIPRTYTTTCKLAPEVNNPLNGGTLSSLASNFGIDIAETNTTDAITPMLYPDLMEDNRFVTELFPITVTKGDGSLRTTYDDYLRHYQKAPFWAYGIAWVKSLLKSDDEDDALGVEMEPSPYILSKDEDDLVRLIRDNLAFDMDKKTGVITITVSDQDPLICKTRADSVSLHLQQFITEYRTNKARTDLEFYQKLVADAKAEYDSVRRKYNSLADANQNVILHRVKSKQDDLENEMMLKFQAYSNLTAMFQQALAKVQERTPAFTQLKGAEMPLKPARPKRMIFVLGMTFLAAVAISLYALRGLIFSE